MTRASSSEPGSVRSDGDRGPSPADVCEQVGDNNRHSRHSNPLRRTSRSRMLQERSTDFLPEAIAGRWLEGRVDADRVISTSFRKTRRTADFCSRRRTTAGRPDIRWVEGPIRPAGRGWCRKPEQDTQTGPERTGMMTRSAANEKHNLVES